MSGYVERGDIAGIVTLIARSDEIHVDAIGMRIRRSVCLRDKDAVKKIPVQRRPLPPHFQRASVERYQFPGGRLSRTLFFVHQLIGAFQSMLKATRCAAHGEPHRGFDVCLGKRRSHTLEQRLCARTITLGTENAKFITTQASDDIE